MLDFERAYAEHAEALLRFVVYRTGDRVLAEDIVADTFERVLRSGRRFDRRRASEKTWIYSIALNLVRDHARREAVAERATAQHLVQQAASATPSGPLDAVDDRDMVMRALVTLAPEEREAIALRYGADLTLPEIAALIKEPLSTVEGRVYRALRKLRETLS